MTRGGLPKTHDEPQRRCLVTRESGGKAGLIRFVAGPDGTVVPDVAEKLPGRGFYVTASGPILEEAVARRVFARGAKAQVTIPEGLVDAVEAQVLRRVQDGIALARKAGQAVSGYEKVRGWLDSGRGRVLVQALDGSGRQKTKLNTPSNGRFVGCLTGAELGLSFGRDHVIHAALAAGPLATRVVGDAAKLSGLRRFDEGRSGPSKGQNAS